MERRIEFMMRKPAPLNPARMRHPKFETSSVLNHSFNHKESINDRDLTHYLLIAILEFGFLAALRYFLCLRDLLRSHFGSHAA